MTTDESLVIGINGGKIVSLKSFNYAEEQEQFTEAMKHVQNEELFEHWVAGHASTWTFSHDGDDSPYIIDVPFPKKHDH